MHNNDFGSKKSLMELWGEHFVNNNVTPSKARKNQTHSSRLIASQIPRRVGSFGTPYTINSSIYGNLAEDELSDGKINLDAAYTLDKTSSSLHSTDGTKRGFIGYEEMETTYVDSYEDYTSALINSVADNTGRTFDE
jgi:hypothetical protein